MTDYVRHIILQGPVYGLDTTLTSKELSGMLSNPMEHGEASKLALYGVADYTWNISSYNPLENWERGLRELVPDAAEAYRTFAIHSCDTETGYRRQESWETETFSLDRWNDGAARALKAEFEKIEKVPSEMETSCANKALLNELRPWLAEFGKLGTRGREAVELMGLYCAGIQDTAMFWEKYASNMMTADDRKAYEAHKSGTMKLQPFYEDAMADMGFGFLASLSGKTPNEYKGIGSFANSEGMTASLMFDGDTTTYYTSGVAQKDGSWVGVDLMAARDIWKVSIFQGRNSVDDVDYFDHAVVEYSIDGENWTALTGELKNRYVIEWSGENVKARYVRLKRLDSDRKNHVAVRSFEVNPCASPVFDGRISTSCLLDGEISWDVPEGTKGCVILARPCGKSDVQLKLRQYAPYGLQLREIILNHPYSKVLLAPGVSRISLSGNAEIVEIVGR